MKRKIDHVALAAQIRRDADRYARANKSDDPEVRAMIARDVRAMNTVADLVEAGDMRRAFQRVARMDTAARDGFSKRAFSTITGGCAFGHGDGA